MTVALATGWWIAGITIFYLSASLIVIGICMSAHDADVEIAKHRRPNLHAVPMASADAGDARDPGSPREGKDGRA